MIIETWKALTNLGGEPIATSQTDSSPITAGKIIGTVLVSHKGRRFDQMKLLELARKFYNATMSVEVDKSDLEGIKEIVKADETFTPLVTGQLLEVLVNAKEPEENRPIDIRKKEKTSA